MRHMEIRTCRKCGSMYMWWSGGIVASPKDVMDRGLCSKCRAKNVLKGLEKLKKGWTGR